MISPIYGSAEADPVLHQSSSGAIFDSSPSPAAEGENLTLGRCSCQVLKCHKDFLGLGRGVEP